MKSADWKPLEEIRELREKIARLKGRLPRSQNLTYLRELHEELRTRVANGENVKVQRAEHTVPVSFSVLPSQLDALTKLCDKLKRSRSDVMREALAEYAAKHGHAGIARALTDEAA